MTWLQFVKILVLWEKIREYSNSLHSKRKYFIFNTWKQRGCVNKGTVDFPLELSQVYLEFGYFKPFQEVSTTAKYQQLCVSHTAEIGEIMWLLWMTTGKANLPPTVEGTIGQQF